jgi:hypothetical protein
LYPHLGNIAKLISIGAHVTPEQNVHPSLIEHSSTESLIKMMRFGLWMDHKMRENPSLGQVDIIRGELKLYENYLGIHSVLASLFLIRHKNLTVLC